MRLTHINSYYFTNKIHEALAEKLSEVRFHIEQHIFQPLPKSSTPAETSIPGVTFSSPRCFSRVDRAIWPLKMRKIWRAFQKDHLNHPAELHHAHTLVVNGLPAYWAKKKYGIPYVVTIRNTDTNFFLKRYAFFRWIAKKILLEADAVVTLSPAYWNQHLKIFYPESFLDLIHSKHHLIPSACDDYWFQNNDAPVKSLEKSIKLLFVGRLDRNKNLRTLLDAGKNITLKGLSWHLTVVGNGPLESELRQLAQDMPVTFEGFVTEKSRILEYYRNADMLVVPSRTESFGVVYAEALTQGTPVIYSKGQGFDGFFEDGVVGYSVEAMNAVMISDRILKLSENLETFSRRAFSLSLKFKWDLSVEAWVELYLRVLKDKSQSPHTSGN